MPETQSIILPDGRKLSYAVYGRASSPYLKQPTVFYFHGFPSSHHEAQAFHAAAERQGVRLVAPSRPGFGGSTYQPNRSLLDWAPDVLALADHLGVTRFAALGVSGGCPHALACLQSIPRERLVGVTVLSGIYPASLGLAGMLFSARALLTIAPWATGLVAFGMDQAMGRLARDAANPDRFAKALGDSLRSRPPEDLAALEADDGALKKVVIESTREAVRVGGQGAAWEARLFGSAWGFDLEQLQPGGVNGRLLLLHGGRDVNVPVAMAEKAAALIPGSELRVEEEEGHVSLMAHKADEALAALVAMLEKE